ncbi:methyltransferase [Pontivivens ytuae]|uniref:methyltransferase n=1 Tax=Pontivivens ytuae TaxID=2789856 RepID=UPI001E4B333A|nr:methyltransferase [Pontivivens ytuae]
MELDLFSWIGPRAVSISEIAARADLPEGSARRLAQAAASLDLLRREGEGYRLGDLGAAVAGVPGLGDMIRHHALFYRDLADPVALLRGEAEPELAQFWPYVMGDAEVAAPVAGIYSRLMASSQALVSEETLRAIDLKDVRHLMDVGGGTGAFLRAALAEAPGMEATLFDLPDVVARAEAAPRLQVVPGSFRTDALPEGADAISLVRVLYDHDDDAVRALLAKVFATLPAGGRIIISEPMSGGARPERAGDAYFGFYTLAMTTGRPRSPAEHAAFLREAGFADIRTPRMGRPFITQVVTARRQS